jgi:hypothetical protein
VKKTKGYNESAKIYQKARQNYKRKLRVQEESPKYKKKDQTIDKARGKRKSSE